MKTLRIRFLVLGVFMLTSLLSACRGGPSQVVPGTPVKLVVRVLDAATSQPLPGARVSLKKDSQPAAADVASGGDGTAAFTVPGGDGYKAFAGNVAGYSPGATPSIKLVADQEVAILMTPSIGSNGLVAGSVKDASNQAPLAGVSVTLNPGAVAAQRVRGPLMQQRVPYYRIQQAGGSTVQTDQAGQFTFKDVPPGSYTANFQYGSLPAVTRPVNVTPGETTAIETVFMGTAGGGNPGGNPGGGTNPGNPNTRGHVLIAEAGRAFQLDPQAQLVWRYQSSGISCATRLPDGNTLVSDEQNNQVSIIGPGGEVVWNMGSSIGLISRLSAPSWVAAARDGKSFLITDSGNNRILEVENGTAGWTFPGLSRPRSATYAANGNVLIADTGNRRVIEVDRAGQIVWSFAQDMSAPVHAVRMEDGNTLITDAGYNRVILINPSGQPVWYFDGAGDALNRPRSTIASRFGTFLIADMGNNRVIETDRSKAVISTVPNLARPQVLERL